MFCGFVLFDTQLIVERFNLGDSDYIKHSLDLFIDFVDIFRRILIIMSSKVSAFAFTFWSVHLCLLFPTCFAFVGKEGPEEELMGFPPTTIAIQ